MERRGGRIKVELPRTWHGVLDSASLGLGEDASEGFPAFSDLNLLRQQQQVKRVFSLLP